MYVIQLNVLITCFPLGGIPLFFEKDPEKNKELREKFQSKRLPRFIKITEQMLDENGGEWLVGKGFTWADLNVAVAFSWCTLNFKEEWESKTPKLLALQKKVYNIGGIKEYIDNRPDSVF